MRIRLGIIWFIICLLLNGVIYSLHAASLNIENILTQADGLASNTVLAIFEDSHGNMWFGTTDGITRYDGNNFQTFTTEDGLSRNTIGRIFEDSNSMLWFGTGLLSDYLERGKPQDMSWMITPLSEIAKELDEEVSEEITRNTPLKGISRYDRNTFRVFTTADGLPRDSVKDIFEDEAGTLWFATSSGVSQYNGETFNTMTLNGPIGMDVLPDWWDQVRAITQDTAGNFWFGSTAGITYYNVKTFDFRYFDVNFNTFQEMEKSPTGNVTDLLFDANDNLWITREEVGEENSGILRYDGKTLVTFPQSEELPMNCIDNIMEDRNGNLWFAGVKNLPGTIHETEDNIAMIYPEIGAGVSTYDGETFHNFNTDDGLPSNRVWSVFEDSSGKLWFATDAGVAVGVYHASEDLKERR